ncbi:methyl-accepting chemotaxis protein [Motilibacter rhizosphaerae]|uniref:Methyl-accepting chemotaxis protein n=1 Tax=Motilibacter rhizosphaerae TaxID=598652 RepID=A0A4V2F4M1_9ACTN|nr:methyl-accepting chemotaxis protein [Motilibacter rhizosphaerae]RZS89799.1 methyl-accepting chemotaxis protein [Motilibacter rhizosphaerae]
MPRGSAAAAGGAAGAAAAAPWALRPALAVTSRLRLGGALAVLIAVLLVPGGIAAGSYAQAVGGQLSFAAQERAGVVVLRPALTALAADVRGDRVDLAPLQAQVAAHPELHLADELRAVSAALGAADAGSPAGRAAVADALVALVTETGNGSKLILDPDLDSFYVMDAEVVQLPRALAAAAAAAVPPSGAADAQVAARAVLAGTVAGAGGSLVSDAATAARSTSAAGLAERLTPLRTAGAAAAQVATATTAASGPQLQQAVRVLADDAVVTGGLAPLDALLATRERHLSSARDLRLGLTALSLLLAVWIAGAVRWRTGRDARAAVGAAAALAGGDLSEQPAPHGRDELASIVRSVDGARRTLVEQQRALRASATELERQQRTHYRDQRLAEQQARDRAQQVVDETSAVVLTELEGVVAQVGDVTQAASGIDDSVREVDEVARAVVAQAEHADELIRTLGESLHRVGSIAGLITGVADQTKMLALNATIEAVRAGAAGRGFAVVADEVKQLAATTASSTEEITSTVSALERDAQALSDAVAATGGCVKAVDAANTSLSGVAGEQGRLVDDLRRSLADAMERVRAMGALGESLERRSSARVPVADPGTLVVRGQGHPVRLLDISEGGARCLLPDGVHLAGDEPVELECALLDRTLRVRALAVRASADGEVGLRFAGHGADEAALISAYVADFLSPVA